jgi:hypothetical protein
MMTTINADQFPKQIKASERLAFPGSFFLEEDYQEAWGDDWQALFPKEMLSSSFDTLVGGESYDDWCSTFAVQYT